VLLGRLAALKAAAEHLAHANRLRLDDAGCGQSAGVFDVLLEEEVEAADADERRRQSAEVFDARWNRPFRRTIAPGCLAEKRAPAEPVRGGVPSRLSPPTSEPGNRAAGRRR
jgi:hypothetical protein